ncbi:MAG: reverse transcriptase domain-containing protein, partial [Candidatus Bathyarchaeota archaeon]
MPHVSGHIRPEWDTISQTEFRNSFKQLNNLHDLAAFWNVAPHQLSYYAFHVDKKRAYYTFNIPRRNGGQRTIEAPGRTLKYIQRLIHESLTCVYGPHPAVHGFRKGRSIVSNAKKHTGKQYVLNVDLADFFPSITRKRIY